MSRSVNSRSTAKGIVYFVGAGPGNPGMLTLRGAECLRTANVVLYDGLVNLALLRHAADDALLECVGKHGQSRIWQQSEINMRLVDEANAGNCVVRLKGGDPVVFGRLAEECDALRSAGIEFEVVPGITAALAAGGYAGIPITYRGHASAVALVTGHEEDGKQESAIDWAALARFPGTLVIYMGVTTAEHWTNALIAGGMPAHTPAALVRRCSWPDQEMIRCRLDDVAAQLTPASKLRPPVIVILGAVVDLQPAMQWFAPQPLAGLTVLVTRAAEQTGELVKLLEDAGAETRIQSAIEIRRPENLTALDNAISTIESFEWIVFSSVNGVRLFFERFFEVRQDVRCLCNAQLACVGSKTAVALADYHLKADLVPDDFRAESLVAAIALKITGKNVLSLRASRGRAVLSDGLRQAGANLCEVVAYESTDVATADAQIIAAIDANQVDWVTVTSSAIIHSLVRLIGIDRLRKLHLASISPITSSAIRDCGLVPTAEANEYTMQGIVQAIIQAKSL